MGQSFEIFGRRLAEDDASLEDALRAAHLQRVHPRCLCHPEGVETYISVAGDGFAIKRIPYTADRHAAWCRFARSPLTMQKAARRRRSFTDRDFESFRRRADELGALLRDLWRAAELTHWKPAFEGRRSWSTVRRHLLSASGAFHWDGVALKKQLYVPETFRSGMSTAIYDRRMAHCLGMLEDSDCAGAMVVIAEVKRIDSDLNGTSLIFKHVPDCGFKLTDYRHGWIDRLFANQFALARMSDDLHLVAAVVASLTPDRNPSILAFSPMVTTPEWLPVRNISERATLAEWMSKRRTFTVEEELMGGGRHLPHQRYGQRLRPSATSG